MVKVLMERVDDLRRCRTRQEQEGTLRTLRIVRANLTLLEFVVAQSHRG